MEMKPYLNKLALFALIFLSASSLEAQTIYPDIWRAVEYSGFRIGQDVCQEYILDLDDNGTGKFTVIINFANNESVQGQFTGMAYFTYIREEGEDGYILLTFEALRFPFQEMPKYTPHLFQPEHLSYVEEWKKRLSGQEVRFVVYLEESQGEVLEMPSIVNSGDAVFFRLGTRMGSCDAMRRN